MLQFYTGHTPSAFGKWQAGYGIQTINGRYRWADIRRLTETRGTNRQAS
jgi:hypothetical protein